VLVATVFAVAGLCLAAYAVSALRPGPDSAAVAGGSGGGGSRSATASTAPTAAVPVTSSPGRGPGVGPAATHPTAAKPTAAAAPRRTAVHPAAPARSPAAPGPRAGTRLFTFVNHVGQTIWLASGEQTARPALTTSGWVLPPGRTLTVRVPDHWNGRFWGRTGCVFDAAGRGHCESGDCDGRFQCPGYGAIPASLAEFNLNSWGGMDFYDVSLVDGSNLPMYINLVGGTTKDAVSAAGCSAAGCTRAVTCPPALQVRAGGRTVGCESPCGVFGTDQYCCRGQWAPRDKCRPDQWPVDYAAVFKKAEPFAYSYVDDDATSTFTSRGEAGYRITFGVSP
jgi:hypothetical protein